jgi:regulation of enolase protein 1 (concanavalin A-like superfamily)
VSLTSPTTGAAYTAPATINLAAAVTANGHTITKVQFYGGTALLGETAAAPYVLRWNGVPAGSYAVSAVALYDSGDAATSASVPVTVSSPANSSGLVAAYGFDEGAGTTVADASGRGNAGVLSGATWTAAGRFGKALSFDGTSSAVIINDSASLDLTGGMTLEAWVYPTALGAWRDVVYKGDDLYYLEAATPVSGACAGVGNSYTNGVLAAPGQLALNAWSHLASSYDGATLRLFVNGVQVASQAWPGPITVSALPLSIGADTLHGSHFAGLIDEVRVYNRALSIGEIQRDLNTPVAQSVSPRPPVSGLSFAADSGVISAPFLARNGSISQDFETGIANGGRAIYTFTIANSGNYIVSAEVNAPHSGANSFFVNIDAEPTDPDMIWNIPVTAGFTNQIVTWLGTGALQTSPSVPHVFTLTAGTHQLIIVGREAGAQLRAISLSLIGLPPPWQTADIGVVTTNGNVSISGGNYTLTGAGILGGKSDNFRFLYQTLSGDGEITAQITSAQNTGPNGFLGVMIRETLNAGSIYAFVGMSSDGNFRLQRRANTDGNTFVGISEAAAPPDAWVRIVRTGDTISRYYSTDGSTWTLTDSRVFPMAVNIYLGLAVASGAADVLNTSTFSNLFVVP